MRFGFWLAIIALSSAVIAAQGSTRNGEWPHWGGDLSNAKYSPLDQINQDNVKTLRIAWRWKADNYGQRPDRNFEVTPLMVNGVLYLTAGSRRDVVAVDAATGETLWMYRYDEGHRGDVAPRRNSGRGVEYWSSPDHRDTRIITITPGFHLVALDARTGVPVPTFGKNGVIDLYDDFDQPIPKDGTIGSSSPPMVIKDVIVAGNALQGGGAPPTKYNTKGYIRGWDVRTGKRLWTFHTIPQPGEVGNETWQNDSWAYTGNTGAWAPLSADEDLGYVYLPVEAPTGDFFGGQRPGSNLFSDSLVCLDAKTGKRVWHFQFVHHDMWDYDTASPPNLVNITVGGRPIKAVAQATKQGFLYVFDRVTGQPVWPIEEKPVPHGDTPTEWYSPTQPIPTRPAPFDRQGVSENDLIDFTPELKAEALQIAQRYRMGPLFTPHAVGKGTLQLPGSQGSALWQGASWDPETDMLYVPSVTNMSVWQLVAGSTRSEMAYIVSDPVSGGSDDEGPANRGSGAARAGGARGGAGRGAPQLGPGVTIGPWGIGPQGLPLLKPPYGRITAYDMNSGDIVFQVANGDTYDWMKTHPALKGIDIPKTGRGDEGGILVTKTLLFAGQGCGLFRKGGGGGNAFYSYDKKTGAVVGDFTLPASSCGSPMTYMMNGKQYIAVSVGSTTSPAELIALTLP